MQIVRCVYIGILISGDVKREEVLVFSLFLNYRAVIKYIEVKKCIKVSCQNKVKRIKPTCFIISNEMEIAFKNT